MSTRFHDKEFDPATKLKLDVFRGYIRKWFPVFLSRKTRREIGVFDLFCGPGEDASGIHGTPMIILDELTNYLASPRTPKAPGVKIGLHFNDADCRNVDALQSQLQARNAGALSKVTLTNSDFQEAFRNYLQFFRRSDTAALVLLDQCGVKQVSESIFRDLVQCPTTDVLFFISSNFVRRFSTEPEIQRHFPNLSPERIKSLPHTDVHRFICTEYYQNLIPPGITYHLAPFSIKKDDSSNVYGVVFGSGKLRGLEKFLEVCWEKDPVTGEANFNIDEDYNWGGDQLAFPGFGSPRKHEQFEASLLEFIAGTMHTNHEVYKFTVEARFLPKHANKYLKQLQDQGRLCVQECETGKRAKKGSFYLSWKHYEEEKPKVRFILKEVRSCGRVE